MSNLRMGLSRKLAKSVGWSTFVPLDSDVSSGYSYPLFEQLGPGLLVETILEVTLFNLFPRVSHPGNEVGLFFDTNLMLFICMLTSLYLHYEKH